MRRTDDDPNASCTERPIGLSMWGYFLIASAILLLGVTCRWVIPWISNDGKPERSPPGLLRVEVTGSAVLEGVYEVPIGTTVGEFLDSLGARSEASERRSQIWSFALGDLCALHKGESKWQLARMSARKAFLLGEPLDVNRADVWDLTLLPGIGPVRARRIVAHRVVHGPFGKPEDLGRVRGIHSRALEAVIAMIAARGEAPPGGPACQGTH
jgi:hypothetical protein